MEDIGTLGLSGLMDKFRPDCDVLLVTTPAAVVLAASNSKSDVDPIDTDARQPLT